MIHDFLLALWFMLPAGVANMAPVLVAKWPVLKDWSTPIDGGRQFRGKPLLGPHKTWRGLLAGIIFATLVLGLQVWCAGHFAWARYLADGVAYDQLAVWALGPLFALGALGGDALESFFKRQRGIESGQAWLGFDQLDYIVGAVILTLPVVRLSLTQYIWIFITWFVLHLAVSFLGYRIGLKDEPI